MKAPATPLSIPAGGPNTRSTTASSAETTSGQITASTTADHLAAGAWGNRTEMPSQRLAQPHTAMMFTLACRAAKTPRASGDRSRDVSSTVNSPEPATAAREITTEEVRPRVSPSEADSYAPCGDEAAGHREMRSWSDDSIGAQPARPSPEQR